MDQQKDKEIEFETLILANLDRAETLLGHRFLGLRALIAAKGARAAACQLLNPANVGQSFAGFNVFMDAGLLDCSIEHAVITFAESGLFLQGVIQTAKARLTIAKLRLARTARPTAKLEDENNSSPVTPSDQPSSEQKT